MTKHISGSYSRQKINFGLVAKWKENIPVKCQRQEILLLSEESGCFLTVENGKRRIRFPFLGSVNFLRFFFFSLVRVNCSSSRQSQLSCLRRWFAIGGRTMDFGNSFIPLFSFPQSTLLLRINLHSLIRFIIVTLISQHAMHSSLT